MKVFLTPMHKLTFLKAREKENKAQKNHPLAPWEDPGPLLQSIPVFSSKIVVTVTLLSAGSLIKNSEQKTDGNINLTNYEIWNSQLVGFHTFYFKTF